ncbi:MAG: CDP-glycerol glycerophosphotransferase family protein [Clostridia bacterium]|nr:CDP-glycerol glycerophosphotransferase family protein [Clostridia bacterium]
MNLRWKIRNRLVKRSRVMKKLIDSAAFRKNTMRYRREAVNPIQENAVVFMSFIGNKYADSPRAIYEYMLNSHEFDDYEFYWFFRFPEKFRFLEENSRTKVFKYNSDEHYKYYATAKYWVTNSRVPDVIPKRDGQIYLQCWHGTPLKRLGFDVKVEGANAKYTTADISKQYSIDAKKYTYMTSPSRFCTEKFISAFGLDRVGREDIIIEEGYPRNDFLSNYTEDDVRRIKKQLNLPEDRKLILYAPTWRDNQHASSVGYVYKEEVDFDQLREELGDEYIILFRAHYFVANSFDFDRYEGFVIDASAYDEINDLYIISDMLITDYSSVFFDYAILKRPIVFYMYDLEMYRDEVRGFYISLDELPGPIITKHEELAGTIRECMNGELDSRYAAFNEKYNYLDDGNACQRVIEKVFR